MVVTVKSYYPVRDVVRYLSETYGWRISYEDPVYPASELDDIAIPEWKKAHPGERGYYVPKWTELELRIPKIVKGFGQQQEVVASLVAQFNVSPRQERFNVVSAPSGRQVLVGTVLGEESWRGARLRPEKRVRSGSEELKLIAEQCGAQMRYPIGLGTLLVPPISVPSRGATVSCRDAVLSLAAIAGADYVYELNEDIGGQMFVLNVRRNQIELTRPH